MSEGIRQTESVPTPPAFNRQNLSPELVGGLHGVSTKVLDTLTTGFLDSMPESPEPKTEDVGMAATLVGGYTEVEADQLVAAYFGEAFAQSN